MSVLEVHLFAVENPSEAPEGGTFLDNLNPNSLESLTDCRLEPSLSEAKAGDRFQFERLGYFTLDQPAAGNESNASPPLVFNRTITLRDAWAKKAGKR